MGKGCMKENTNMYFLARKEAAVYNEKLYSREGASEVLGMSVSTIAGYELGLTKVVPVDAVVRMAELYRCPELKTSYCKNECPIGRELPIATSISGIEGIALELIRKFDSNEMEDLKTRFADIALDGNVSDEEKNVLKGILEKVDEMALVISKIKLLGEKALKG